MRFLKMHNSLISYRLFEQTGDVIAFTTTRNTFIENDAPRFSGNFSKKKVKYYSARREGIETGRLVSGIRLV
jgi:hypothetical protein